jgi:hypothetical protein
MKPISHFLVLQNDKFSSAPVMIDMDTARESNVNGWKLAISNNVEGEAQELQIVPKRYDEREKGTYAYQMNHKLTNQ